GACGDRPPPGAEAQSPSRPTLNGRYLVGQPFGARLQARVEGLPEPRAAPLLLARHLILHHLRLIVHHFHLVAGHLSAALHLITHHLHLVAHHLHFVAHHPHLVGAHLTALHPVGHHLHVVAHHLHVVHRHLVALHLVVDHGTRLRVASGRRQEHDRCEQYRPPGHRLPLRRNVRHTRSVLPLHTACGRTPFRTIAVIPTGTVRRLARSRSDQD